MTISRRLKKLRKRAGMSIRDLGAASRVPYQSIALIERDRCSPTIRTAAKIARGLGVTLANLVKVAVRK
jgi:transcriptional regulator with XRE-family HTH domain